MLADKEQAPIRGTAAKLVFWGLALSGFLFVVVRYYVKGQDILESVLMMLTLWLMLIWTNYTEQGISQFYVIARKFPRYWKFQRRSSLIVAIVVSVGFIVGYVGKHFFG